MPTFSTNIKALYHLKANQSTVERLWTYFYFLLKKLIQITYFKMQLFAIQHILIIFP